MRLFLKKVSTTVLLKYSLRRKGPEEMASPFPSYINFEFFFWQLLSFSLYVISFICLFFRVHYLHNISQTIAYLISFQICFKSPCVALAPKVKYLLLRYPNSVTVWKLNIGKNPIKLIEWRPPTGLRVKSASISANGQWFVCSTADRLRLYSLKIVSNLLCRHIAIY